MTTAAINILAIGFTLSLMFVAAGVCTQLMDGKSFGDLFSKSK